MKNNYMISFFGLIFILNFINDNFYTAPAVADVQPPVLIAPDGDIYTIEDSITLTWSNAGKKIVYEVMISQDENFINNQRFSSVDTVFSLEIKNLHRGVWYWKVRSFKNKDTYSDWSAPFYFAKSELPEIQRQSGCNGNCGACTHPCGRRRMQEYPVGE